MDRKSFTIILRIRVFRPASELPVLLVLCSFIAKSTVAKKSKLLLDVGFKRITVKPDEH